MWGYILKRIRILFYLVVFAAIYHFLPYPEVAFLVLGFFVWSDLIELIDDITLIKRALKAKETEIWSTLLTKRKHF